MKKLSVILVAAVMLAVCVLGFAACGETKIADNTEHFTEITDTLNLNKTYEGKKLFSNDGIGEANLLSANVSTTDGDTTLFGLKEGGSVNVRYEGVNTPESTGDVQKWGKAASNFTNERLHEATAIVIESANGKSPDRDSTSSRYMCYVWYKTADHDFYLLNLELVENGFSYNKESASSPYYSYFQKAEKFARGIELRLFSKLDDPLFSNQVSDFSLKDFNANPDSYQENVKVRVLAYVSDVSISTTGSYTFTIAQYDQTENRVYTMTVFAGYNGYATGLRVGDLYQIVGTLQKHSGKWQISGVEGDNDDKGEPNTSWRSQIGYYVTFDPTDHLYTEQLTTNAYGALTVTSEPTLNGTTLTFEGSAEDFNGDALTGTFTVTVPSGYNNAITNGSTLVISGAYQFVNKSHEYTILSYSNITIQ